MDSFEKYILDGFREDIFFLYFFRYFFCELARLVMMEFLRKI